jgi:hypothetical protein
MNTAELKLVPNPSVANIQSAPKKIKKTSNYSDCTKDVTNILNFLLHKEFPHLARFKFRLIFREKINIKKGRRVLATIKKNNELQQLLTTVDFIIVIEKKYWIEHPEHQEILLFHELCHVETDEEGEPRIVGHDIEEFCRVWEKYGDWQRKVSKKCIEQLKLFSPYE